MPTYKFSINEDKYVNWNSYTLRLTNSYTLYHFYLTFYLLFFFRLKTFSLTLHPPFFFFRLKTYTIRGSNNFLGSIFCKFVFSFLFFSFLYDWLSLSSYLPWQMKSQGWTLPKSERKKKKKGNMIWDSMFLSAFVTIIIKLKKNIIYLMYHANGYPI